MMQEIFYEESSKTQSVKSSKAKYNTFLVLSIINWVLFGVWLYFSIMLFPLTTEFLLYNILYVLVPASAFVATAILLGIFKNRFYVDYDYTFISGEIRVSKVIKEIKRRGVIKFSTAQIEKMGKYGSETYLSYQQMPNVKRMILTSNITAEDGKQFYYLVINDTEKKLLILECTETFLVNILKFSNKSIVEKDYA